ncbi:MAG: NADH-quinone oxidoreductase subunit C [Gammaproteobacteria bacterium]|nr:NADH-quinone oxidoreductase subunit C [Gammaproteobacteria bacterium]
MANSLEAFHTRLREFFGDKILASRIATGQVTIEILPDQLSAVCKSLRDEEQFAFAQLSDVCGVDYLSYGKADWETQDTTSTGFSRGVSGGVYNEEIRGFPARFAVVYHLLSIKHNRRLRVRCFVPGDPPKVNSVVDIWASANWFERETFDLFGILFDGHPDLRRILTDYGFIGHPFRKDFPLEGNVEVIYDAEKKRVVYQPVSIENRVLVPKVIRHDHRYEKVESKK